MHVVNTAAGSPPTPLDPLGSQLTPIQSILPAAPSPISVMCVLSWLPVQLHPLAHPSPTPAQTWASRTFWTSPLSVLQGTHTHHGLNLAVFPPKASPPPRVLQLREGSCIHPDTQPVTWGTIRNVLSPPLPYPNSSQVGQLPSAYLWTLTPLGVVLCSLYVPSSGPVFHLS